MKTPHRRTGLLLAAAAAALVACGGADPDVAEPVRPQSADLRAQILAAPPVVAPLLDDEGRVLPGDPEAEPADAQARTRAGRYATAAQAEQLAHAGSARVVQVAPAANGPAAIEQAVADARRDLEADATRADAPVLVRGGDLALAARVADRLADAGHGRVFLVTR